MADSFSLLVGLGLIIGYALLGAAWLIWKTEAASKRMPAATQRSSPRPS
jgi:cytochrome bd-type quinol oxidase subunit 2